MRKSGFCAIIALQEPINAQIHVLVLAPIRRLKPSNGKENEPFLRRVGEKSTPGAFPGITRSGTPASTMISASCGLRETTSGDNRTDCREGKKRPPGGRDSSRTEESGNGEIRPDWSPRLPGQTPTARHAGGLSGPCRHGSCPYRPLRNGNRPLRRNRARPECVPAQT